MRRRDERLVFSPSDLLVFFESPFASWMDRRLVEEPGVSTPDAPDSLRDILIRHGHEHERQYIERLRSNGVDVLSPPETGDTLGWTLDAMKGGAPAIHSGTLAAGDWQGTPDLLVRVDLTSALGNWSYVPIDCKLGKTLRPEYLIQLSAYADLLEAVQGAHPQTLVVVTVDGSELTTRTSDVFYHYLTLRDSYLAFQRNFRAERPPVPDGHSDHGRWASHAERWLKGADHLSQVAALTRHQVKRLKNAGVATMSDLGQCSLRRVPRMEQATFDRLREQASLQIMSARSARPHYRVLRASKEDPRCGLSLLPPSSPGDLHFDIEGYPFVEGGLEYLFGVYSFHDGVARFDELWAHDSEQERTALTQFLRLAHGRFQTYPAMHIYHYGNYEVSALVRLAGKFGVAEDKLDDLLRNEVFVDVLKVVRQGIRVGTPAYSLKQIERLYRPQRAGQIVTAAESVVQYSRWLARPDGTSATTSEILHSIRDYNRDDCESLQQLVAWLRQRQLDEGIPFVPPLPKADDAPLIPEGWRASESIGARLLSTMGGDASDSPARLTQELLGQIVTFHRRESKALFRTRYAWRGKSVEELIEDSDCLGGLKRTTRAPEPFKSSLIYEYEFDPNQDTSLGASDSCLFLQLDGDERLLVGATVHAIDLPGGRVEIRLGEGREAPPGETSLIPDEFVDPEPIAASIRRQAEIWERTRRLQPALDALFHRSPPRMKDGSTFSADSKIDQVASVTRAAANLADSCLAIQGPPGTGKTFAAARAILELAVSGRRVAVTSNSHAAIQKVLSEVLAVAAKRGDKVRLARIGGPPQEAVGGVVRFGGIDEIDFGASDAPQVVGGTAWALSSPGAQDRFEHLFVDEAGQVSLANLVGMAPCARNLVLLGDQMQLSTPTRGAHPGASGASALGYLLEGHPTVPRDLGIFLGKSRRLPEKICGFISDAIYEGRLTRDAGAPVRSLRGQADSSRFGSRKTGIFFVPVEHEGNTRSSDEEVEVIRTVVDDLKMAHVAENGVDRALVDEDIIVVTPYNLQVRALSGALPSLRVGTVDRFQGQQATVVIMSMCASAGEDCARGLDFLLDPHRLNVAISRATTMAIVVGHPALARSRVTSVSQLRHLNLFARLGTETVDVQPTTRPTYASRPIATSKQAGRAAEHQERYLTVSASNTVWGVDELSVKRFIEGMHQPDDGGTWFGLRREAETLALTPSFDRLITLESNAIKELPHQIAVARQVLNRPMAGRAILADEVGLGKTIEAGIILKELAVRGLARRILILTPAALVEQWREELLSKFFEAFSTPATPDDWQHCARAVVSYDRARQKDHKEAILRHQWDLVIADEAHKVKNHQTLTYQTLQQVHRNFMLLLTATPLQNSLRELYNLVTLLRPGQLGTWSDFRRKYVKGGDPRKAKNPEALRELTSQVMVRTRRANVASTIQLPPRRPSHPSIQLTPEEWDLYRDTTQLLRDLYREGFYQPDEAEEEADRVRRKRYTGKGNLSRMMMLLSQRLCSSPQALADSLENLAEGEHILPEYRTRALRLAERSRRVTTLAKLEALTRVLSGTGERVIVFTDHLATLKLIERRVQSMGRVPIIYAGSVPRQERNERLVQFKRTEGAVFLTTRAGGEGLNLQFCNWLVNYELPWNPMVVEQRIGRIHRIGQEKEVHIVNFAAQGTIEAHVLKLLDEKIRLFELVVGELDVILGKFGEPDDLEKQLRSALLSSKDDAEFEEKLVGIGEAIAESREEGLKQEQATSDIAAEDAGGRLAQEFAVLSIPARVRLGYGTIHLKHARGVEVKRCQLAIRVPEIIEALEAANAEPAGRHPDYGNVHLVSGRTGRGRTVSLLVKADSLPMVLADIDASLEGVVGTLS